MSVAAPIVLRPGDESRLRTVLRCSTAGAGVAQRARIVLLAAEGVSNAEIGRRVGVSRPTVLTWRARYEQSGIVGLGDLDRSGRPPVIDGPRYRRRIGSGVDTVRVATASGVALP